MPSFNEVTVQRSAPWPGVTLYSPSASGWVRSSRAVLLYQAGV
ncbi:hypothetical protein [Variovorax sp. YR750]|nr:hypothetical protein [Variovorax sp. YR750]